MTSLQTKIRTYWSLRPINLFRVAIYRLKIKLGWFKEAPVNLLTFPVVFFRKSHLPSVDAPLPQLWLHEGLLFDLFEFPVGDDPPDWLADPITGKKFPNAKRIWWRVPDFDNGFGDIKRIWELSRFGWAIAMAQRARNGDEGSLARLNKWVEDWCLHNPPFYGPNWKCGQEASIRLMHLAMASLILGQQKGSEKALLTLVKQHLERIAPTIHYAAAQENNHATSEAAALFIGGSWLVANGDPSALNFQLKGREKLEAFVHRLVSEDGSFSQHSVNYHRLFLDTISMCELWRRALSLDDFSETFNARMIAASDWLRHFIFSNDGDCPNLGANDGARLLALTDARYRDFRLSCQLSTVLFRNTRAFADSSSDRALKWTHTPVPAEILPVARSKIFSDGGYAILRQNASAAMMRFPRRKFRPSHCDALHVDLWVRGRALLRDGGTYSYNHGSDWLDYFSGDPGHNSVQFGKSPQMPRVGRFLFGDWLETKTIDPLEEAADFCCFGARYVNRHGYSHYRKIKLYADKCIIVDSIGGFSGDALARWRLCPGDWEIHDGKLTSDLMDVEVVSDRVKPSLELHTGFESHHYMQKTELPVLHVKVSCPSTLTTTFRWAA